MAAPMFSPTGGVGTTYTDPQTGTNYRYNGFTWTQMNNSPAPTQATTYSTPTSTATKTTSTGSSTPRTAQDLVNMGYYGYAGWNDAAALQDFQKTGGAGKGGPTNSSSSGGDPMSQVNNMIQNSFQDLITQANQKFGEYQSTHPFSLDQVLADKAIQAKEQVDPYYNETLTNYLTGVTRRIARSNQDTQNVLNELNAQTNSYTRDTQIKLDEALRQSNEGFADAGLLNSGQNLRNNGLTSVTTGNQLADYMRGQAYKSNQATLGNQRTLEDINLESTQQQRDIGRQQYTAEQTLTNQLANEAGQQYVRGFQATLPPQLQAASGFDLLKQLGIPS